MEIPRRRQKAMRKEALSSIHPRFVNQAPDSFLWAAARILTLDSGVVALLLCDFSYLTISQP